MTEETKDSRVLSEGIDPAERNALQAAAEASFDQAVKAAEREAPAKRKNETANEGSIALGIYREDNGLTSIVVKIGDSVCRMGDGEGNRFALAVLNAVRDIRKEQLGANKKRLILPTAAEIKEVSDESAS